MSAPTPGTVFKWNLIFGGRDSPKATVKRVENGLVFYAYDSSTLPKDLQDRDIPIATWLLCAIVLENAHPERRQPVCCSRCNTPNEYQDGTFVCYSCKS